MSRRHLAREDRESLVIGRCAGLSFRETAAQLGRHRSTLSRGVHRHGGTAGYGGVRAQERYHAARQACGRSLKAAAPAVREALRRGRRKHWSPEQVVHREELPLSVPTVYPGPSAEGCRRRFSPCFEARGRGTRARGRKPGGSGRTACPSKLAPRARRTGPFRGTGRGIRCWGRRPGLRGNLGGTDEPVRGGLRSAR